MRALLDVNVLIALLDSDHSLYRAAITWFEKYAGRGWASCPITENGCVRVMANSGYANPFPAHAVIERLADAAASSLHRFWPDDLSLPDPVVIDPARIHGSRQITDHYLLALAVKNADRPTILNIFK